MPMTLLLLLACGRLPADATAYPKALIAVDADPGQAVVLCAKVGDPALRADCVTAGAERVATQDPEAAASLCAAVPSGVAADECAFQVAEKARAPERCGAAGRFADDCRLHLWSQALPEIVRPDQTPGSAEGAARSALATYGFTEDDLRPWSAFYRELLNRQSPLDRGSCTQAPSPALVEACQRTGAVLYSDRLNRARDHRQFPCDGSPLPLMLQTTADPELEAMVARRRGEDLCPGETP